MGNKDFTYSQSDRQKLSDNLAKGNSADKTREEFVESSNKNKKLVNSQKDKISSSSKTSVSKSLQGRKTASPNGKNLASQVSKDTSYKKMLNSKNVKGSIASAGSSLQNNLFQDSDLEDENKIANKSIGANNKLNKAKNFLEKNHSTSTATQVISKSNKKGKANIVAEQVKAQSHKLFRRKVETSAAAAAVAKGGSKAAVGATAGSASSGVLAPVAGFIAVAFVILGLLISLIIVLVVLVGSFADDDGFNTSGMSPNEAAIANYLHGKGLNNARVAGIMGNFSCESNCNPQQVQHGCGYCTGNHDDTSACYHQLDYPSELINNGSAGYGIAQWTSPGRSQGLVDYAASKDKPSGDMTVQLDYFWIEFQGSLDEYNTISGIENLTTWFHNDYERSADTSMDARIEAAKRFLGIMNKNSINGDWLDYAKKCLDTCKAYSQNDPPRWNQNSEGYPEETDCSGFVWHVYNHIGCTAPHWYTGSMKTTYFDKLQDGEEQPGDVFITDVEGSNAHTYLYIGDNQGIECTTSGTAAGCRLITDVAAYNANRAASGYHPYRIKPEYMGS